MTTTTHRLVRDGQPAPRVDRRERAAQFYRCTCGFKFYAGSRRQALPLQRMHRADIADAR